MSYEIYAASYDDQVERAAYLMRLFNNVRTRRVNYEVQWEESAAIFLPEYRNSFSFGHERPPGIKYTHQQVDATGPMAAQRFMAICDAMLTPYNMLWSMVRPGFLGSATVHKDLMKDRDAKKYFDDVTNCLWYHRYRAEANFQAQQSQSWLGNGVFGNHYMLVDELDQRPGRFAPGLRYMSQSVGQIYRLRNHQGRTDGYIRHFRWTARQAYQCWPDTIPPALRAALDQNSQILYDFLQFVLPRTDYDPNKLLSPQGKAWSSTYFSLVGYAILEDGGYRTFPLPSGGYMWAPEEDYARGPGQIVLAEAKTLNAEKGVFLKQGHRAADPSYLLADDGLTDFKSHPGSYNYGGMSADGKPLVGVLPTGDIQVTQEMMAESAKIVNGAFLVDLFPLLFDQKGGQRSAREVIEMANQMGIFLAPALGGQFTYLGALIDRELDVLSRLRLLPKLPPILKEAKGEYQIIYSSPLARAMRGQAIAGYMRTVQFAQEVVNITGDPSLMDRFDFDESLPEIADDQFVPARWMASLEQVAAKAKQRAQVQARDDQLKALPGLAAMKKADAITAKAQTGGNIGGTLSGTPQGGMPQVPGNPQGQPGQPGVNGQPGQQGQPAP